MGVNGEVCYSLFTTTHKAFTNPYTNLCVKIGFYGKRCAVTNMQITTKFNAKFIHGISERELYI
jgi:hypothetical protein